MNSNATDAWVRLLDVVSGLVAMLEQARYRTDVDLASLKTQCFDLVLEAIVTNTSLLTSDTTLSALVQERARTLLDQVATYQRNFVDVRLHLIELAEDWRCAACGRDVPRGAVVVSKSPLVAVLVCKACGAKSPPGSRGEQRLQELFGSLASTTWVPGLNGFLT